MAAPHTVMASLGFPLKVQHATPFNAVSCTPLAPSAALGTAPFPARRRPHFVVRATSEPSQKNLEIMRKFSEQYARKSETYFCADKGVTAVVIKGLAEHKENLGAPLCPCRYYEDKVAEVQQGFWNCPCVPMRERKECHCMLFLTPDADFAGEEQATRMRRIMRRINGVAHKSHAEPFSYRFSVEL